MNSVAERESRPRTLDYIEPRQLSRISSYGGGFGQFVSLVTDGTVLACLSVYRRFDGNLFIYIQDSFSIWPPIYDRRTRL